MRCVPVNMFITDGRILKCYSSRRTDVARISCVCTFLNRSQNHIPLCYSTLSAVNNVRYWFMRTNVS